MCVLAFVLFLPLVLCYACLMPIKDLYDLNETKITFLRKRTAAGNRVHITMGQKAQLCQHCTSHKQDPTPNGMARLSLPRPPAADLWLFKKCEPQAKCLHPVKAGTGLSRESSLRFEASQIWLAALPALSRVDRFFGGGVPDRSTLDLGWWWWWV